MPMTSAAGKKKTQDARSKSAAPKGEVINTACQTPARLIRDPLASSAAFGFIWLLGRLLLPSIYRKKTFEA